MSMKFLGIVAACIGVIVAVSAALMYSGILPNPFIRLALNPPEHSARYYPRSTVTYIWVSLYPQDGQREQMMEMWDRFNEYDAVADSIEEFEEDAGQEGEFTFEEDIRPWIGADASIGFFEPSRGSEMATLFTISVRDKGAARDFFDEWADYMNDEEGSGFEYSRVDGNHIWQDESDVVRILADNMVLLLDAEGGDLEQALEVVLELIEGEEDRNLAQQEQFQDARAALRDRRFASVFVNFEELADTDAYLGDLGGLAETAEISGFPDWGALSVQFIDRGLALDIAVPNEESYGSGLPDLEYPGKRVSSRTVGLLATTFDPDLNNWREKLVELGEDNDDIEDAVNEIYPQLFWLGQLQDLRLSEPKDDPTMADVLDLGLALFEDYSDIDLEEDLLDLLAGTLILAVEEFDWRKVENNPEEETVNVVGMLSYRSGSEEQLADTLEDLVDLIPGEADIEIDSVDVGADRDAEVFSLDSDYIETDYEPGYVIHDGYLTFGTTEEALEGSVAAQKGSIEDLASVAEYQRAVAALPDDRQVLAWVNLKPFVAQLGAENYMEDDEYQVLEESIGSAGASFKADTQYLRASVVLTFFPE